MKPNYREDKAAQAAAMFLKLGGGQMSHLKLLKLLYLAEREALLRWRRPITYDSYVSMPHGPVLSQTLDVLNGYTEVEGPWKRAISSPANNKVRVVKDPGAESLSEAEEELIREVYEKYGNLSQWAIRDITHRLPEWEDPRGSSIPIDYKDILKGAGKTEVEIASIIDELENIALMDSSMGQ